MWEKFELWMKGGCVECKAEIKQVVAHELSFTSVWKQSVPDCNHISYITTILHSSSVSGPLRFHTICLSVQEI